jgi:3-deoxy-D-manno-octulosonic-acid transferase
MLLDSAVLHGPNVANFAPSYRALDAAGATRMIDGPEQLAKAVGSLLADQSVFDEMIQSARTAHETLMPDLDGIRNELLALLEHSA